MGQEMQQVINYGPSPLQLSPHSSVSTLHSSPRGRTGERGSGTPPPRPKQPPAIQALERERRGEKMDPAVADEIPQGQGVDPTFLDGRRLRRPVPPADSVSKVLGDDNLLIEILVRLPPKPSSLPRTSAVCKRWASILSDPLFHKRFRRHHRKPPLLGFFDGFTKRFTPIMDSPDRIPAVRLSMPKSGTSYNHYGVFMGCRHGLVVLINARVRATLVWDPLTGKQHIVAFPRGLDDAFLGHLCTWHAAVFCADAEDGHVHGDCFSSPFKLVLLCGSGYNRKAFCSVYDSASRVWGDVFSTMITNKISVLRASILVGNALCWLISEGGVLLFDVKIQSLDVIDKPVDCPDADGHNQLLRMEDGGLGLAVLLNMTIQLWERKSNCDGIVEWVLLRKTIPLEGIFPRKINSVFLVGYDEDTNVIVLYTMIGHFTLQLDSMQSKHIESDNSICCSTCYPYTNFYTAGRAVGRKGEDPEL